MDEDEGNALETFSAELEEHLYAKIHHEPVECAPRAEAPRVVVAGGQKGRNGRYFGVGGVAGKSGWKKFGKKSAPILGIDKEVAPVGGRPAVRFTPYQSFLEGIKVSSNAVKAGNPGNMRKNPARLFRKPQDVPPEAPKVSSKRERAKKNRRKDKKKLHTIVLDSSEDEKDDDVVEVPVPPPPLVCLDSSDESEAPKKVPRVAQRGSSPSSSILSDDFIAAQDRRRLEALDVVHVADEELRTVQQQSKSPPKRKAPLSDISTSDSEDFLPDEESDPKRHVQKRQCRPPSPKETPYIHKGEALPSAVTLPRKSIDTTSSHRSDEEFMTILSTIANGEASNEPLEIPDSPEEVPTDIVLNIERREETPEPQDDLPESDGSEEEEEEEAPGQEEEEPPKLLHGWNEEMRRFYEESWGGEKFSVQNIIKQMPDNNQWQISARDFNYSRFHRTWREPQELKLVCYMCGDSGHREPRCPNTLCLKCGNRTMVFGIACSKCADWSSSQCDVCHTLGHKSELCPDLWRRYHSTVDDGAPKPHQGALNERKCCSICSKQGHTADTCQCPVRLLEYPASPWKVSSYEAVYETTDKVDNSPDPFQTYRGERARFVWSDNVQRAQFYERFLRHCSVERSEEGAKEQEKMIEVEPEAPSVIQMDNAESKIVLHNDYCMHLMRRYGQQFLKSLADELCVEVNLRTSSEGNLLKLRGEMHHLADFRQRLMHFFTMQTRRGADMAAQREGAPCLPQNRLKMVQVVRKSVARLTRYIGNAREIFREMRVLEKDPDRVSGANEARTQLNMILLGQLGLGRGHRSLRALEADITMVEKQHQGTDVPPALRNSINGNFRCIFTPFIHGNYDRMMKQFNKMKKHRVLPAVAVPRREGWKHGKRL